MFSIPIFYMSCAKIPDLRSFQHGVMSLSRASTRRRYSRILGITSWYQSLLRPRSPHWLIESLTVESRHTLKIFCVLYLYRRVGFLCFSSPFSLVRTPDVYSCLSYLQNLHKIFFRNPASILGLFRCSCDKDIVPDASCYRGVELRGIIVTSISRQY